MTVCSFLDNGLKFLHVVLQAAHQAEGQVRLACVCVNCPTRMQAAHQAEGQVRLACVCVNCPTRMQAAHQTEGQVRLACVCVNCPTRMQATHQAEGQVRLACVCVNCPTRISRGPSGMQSSHFSSLQQLTYLHSQSEYLESTERIF